MTPQPPRTAVVVVNYGSSALLARNLAAVAAADPALTVVVVDNFSTEDERAAVTALCADHRWTLVASPTNTGFGIGNNLGATRALDDGAEQILLLNPDARIDGESLDRLRRIVATDPMTLAAPLVTTSTGRVWSAGTDLYLDSGAMRASRKRVGEPRVETWLSGACLLLSAELWTTLGGFDERYFLYWEDVDLCWRARRVGATLRLVEDAVCVHDEGGTQADPGQRARSATYYYYNIRNRLLFAGLHLERADRQRWLVTAPAQAWAVLLRGGRRQLLESARPWRAAIRGTLHGVRLALRPPDPPGPPSPIRVLQSFPDPRPTTNPYIVMLAQALRADPEQQVDTFSVRRLLTGRYDVFHAHWPEILVSGRTPARRAVRQLLFTAGLLRLRWRRTAIVRTLHNLELPQGISRREVALLRWFERQTTLAVRLNTTTDPADRPYATVPHGHYRDWFDAQPRSAPQPGRLGYAGLIRRYKAVDTLVAAFRASEPGQGPVSLWVGGRPSTDELRDELTAMASGDERISLQLDFLTDLELVAGLTSAELVVLPYREMHNSGSVLATLSVDRPVLVPDNEVNGQLAAEVGADWVQRYTPPLTAPVLATGLAAVRAAGLGRPGARPDLSQRDWSRTAAAHRGAYRRAVALRREPI